MWNDYNDMKEWKWKIYSKFELIQQVFPDLEESHYEVFRRFLGSCANMYCPFWNSEQSFGTLSELCIYEQTVKIQTTVSPLDLRTGKATMEYVTVKEYTYTSLNQKKISKGRKRTQNLCQSSDIHRNNLEESQWSWQGCWFRRML